MKVFISHQQADSRSAFGIAARLKVLYSIDSYLDVIDPTAEHLSREVALARRLFAAGHRPLLVIAAST